MVRLAGWIFIGSVLGGCATESFPYKYYALRADSYEGTLKGPDESEDLPLKMCSPTEQDQAPCLLLFTPVFLRLKENYLKCQIDLESIQRGIE